MHIVICGSIDFTKEIGETSKFLIDRGHTTEIPLTSQRILRGELTLEDFSHERDSDTKEGVRESAMRKINDNVIRRYFEIIQKSDAILVLNKKKKDVENYIGGNTFLEMGFAHVLEKKIFLLNEIPDISYADEIRAMQPTVLHGNISLIG